MRPSYNVNLFPGKTTSLYGDSALFPYALVRRPCTEGSQLEALVFSALSYVCNFNALWVHKMITSWKPRHSHSYDDAVISLRCVWKCIFIQAIHEMKWVANWDQKFKLKLPVWTNYNTKKATEKTEGLVMWKAYWTYLL